MMNFGHIKIQRMNKNIIGKYIEGRFVLSPRSRLMNGLSCVRNDSLFVGGINSLSSMNYAKRVERSREPTQQKILALKQKLNMKVEENKGTTGETIEIKKINESNDESYLKDQIQKSNYISPNFSESYTGFKKKVASSQDADIDLFNEYTDEEFAREKFEFEKKRKLKKINEEGMIDYTGIDIDLSKEIAVQRIGKDDNNDEDDDGIELGAFEDIELDEDTMGRMINNNNEDDSYLIEEDGNNQKSIEETLKPDDTNEIKLDDVVQMLEDVRAQDVVVINTKNKCNFCNYKIFVTGQSFRHMRVIGNRYVKELKKRKARGYNPVVEGWDCDDWMCVDGGVIVLHILSPEGRARYDLERKWMFQTLDQYDKQNVVENEMLGQKKSKRKSFKNKKKKKPLKE